MYEKAKKNVTKAANQIVENINEISSEKHYSVGKYDMAKKNVKMASNQIVENIEGMAKGGKTKTKDYLDDGVAVVDGSGMGMETNMKITGYGVKGGIKGSLGKYVNEQVKSVKNSSKKVKIDLK